MDRKIFTLRLTPEQHEVLERKAREEGLSKNEYLAQVLGRGDKFEEIIERLDRIEKYVEKK